MMKLSIFLSTIFVGSVGASDKCCCCELSDYYEINRVWTTSASCESPKVCCDIPSKYECELGLNPTFDGSCGHNGESSYQSKNGGPSAVTIPRNGESDSYDMKGWFGQRLMDEKGNEIQEWCLDNGDYDSFFLFRYVPCNGDYPSWFGRCVFPSANNALIYAECDSHDYTKDGCDYSEFSSTIPSCFGEIEEINIGYGSDYGRDVDYRLLPQQTHEWIWCADNGKPTDPPDSSDKKLMYDGDALGKGDGITPFYLQQCRNVVSVTNNDVALPNPLLIATNGNSSSSGNSNANSITEMKPLSFRVSVELEATVVDNLDNKRYVFGINGNNMPYYYRATLKYGDSWSLLLRDVSISNVVNITVPRQWKYTVKAINEERDTYVTFVNNNELDIQLFEDNSVSGFSIGMTKEANAGFVSWIARSWATSGTFVGYGKMFV